MNPRYTDIPQLPEVYTLVQTNSSSWGGGGGDTTVQSNSANWNTAYNTATVFQANSASYATRSFVDGKFLPLSGGTITGNLSVLGSVISRIPLIFTTLSGYTLSLTDQSDLITINNSLSSFVYIPNDTLVNFEDGSQINITRLGSGMVTISALAGVTLRSADNRSQLRAQNSTATIVKLSANDWILFGDIS